MLRTIRQHLKSLSITLWLVIASFLGTIFLVWGMQSAGPGTNRNPAVATVNGERILWPEFQEAFRRQVETLRQIYGEKWKEDLIRELDIRQRVLDSLITSRLLLQEAERLGLTVSREELAHAVMQNPLFAEEGKFSRGRYLRLLEANRLTPERYEESVHQDLLHQKLATLIQASAKVSEAEAWEAFQAAREKVRVTYATLPKSEENKTRLETLEAQLKAGASWEKVMQNSGLKLERPEPLTFGSPVVGLLDARPFSLAILRLKKGEVSPVVEGGSSYFLIRLLSRETVSRDAFEKEKAKWMQELLQEKRERIWLTWVQGLKGRAKVEIAKELT